MAAMESEQAVAYHTRWMIRRDLPDVLALDGLKGGTPWGEEGFLAILRQRNCIGFVAEAGLTVAGYIVYELHKRHLGISRIGGGIPAMTILARKLVGKLSTHRRTRLVADIDEADDAACMALFDAGLGGVECGNIIRFSLDLEGS
jgi:[ribosomal protein S18]-alanine N-acetyltransferase